MIGDRPIERRKLYEQVEDRLRDLIVSGQLKPGDRLPSEHELMERFGVGRPAVREALLTLERQGFLRLRSGSPAEVTRPSPAVVLRELTTSVRSFMADQAGMRNLQAARQLIECAIVREVARTRTAKDVARIGDALAVQEASLGNDVAFENADVAFHAAIVRSLNNPIFESTQLALSTWLLDQRRTTLKRRGRDRLALDEHRAVFKAIENGKPEEAEAAMTFHLERTVAFYWAAVEEKGKREQPCVVSVRNTNTANGEG